MPSPNRVALIERAFWADPMVRQLPAVTKVVALYTMTGPCSKPTGLYRLDPSVAEDDLQIPAGKLKKSLSILEKKGFCSSDGEIILVKNMAAYQISDALGRGDPRVITAMKSLLEHADTYLLWQFCSVYVHKWTGLDAIVSGEWELGGALWSKRFDQPGEGDWELAWEYWDGAAWQPLPNLDDLTNAFRPPFPGFESCTWDVPPDWASQLSPTGSGLTLFFVRARLSVFTAMTVQPLAGRIVFFHYEPVIPSAYPPGGDITWAILDFRESNLGLKIAQAQAFSGGRDDDLYILGDERGVYQQPFETDDVFRERAARLADVVSPLAIIQAINRALRPLGFQGDAIDVTIDNTAAQNLLGAGFTGLFFDLPAELAPSPPGILAAFDLYAPGDENPQNPWLVTQSLEEAYGWFLVLLPWLGEGDFGIFLDEGPLYWDEAAQVYYGPSFFGFIDGFPIDGYATYSAIYNTIEPIKAGGVGFTMIRRENLTVPVEC